MSRLARITAAQIIRVLEKRGFSLSESYLEELNFGTHTCNC